MTGVEQEGQAWTVDTQLLILACCLFSGMLGWEDFFFLLLLLLFFRHIIPCNAPAWEEQLSVETTVMINPHLPTIYKSLSLTSPLFNENMSEKKVSHYTVVVSPWSLSCLHLGYYRDRFKRLFPLFFFLFSVSPLMQWFTELNIQSSRSLGHARLWPTLDLLSSGCKGKRLYLWQLLPILWARSGGSRRRKSQRWALWVGKSELPQALIATLTVYILCIMQSVCFYTPSNWQRDSVVASRPDKHRRWSARPITYSHFIHRLDTLIKDRTANGNALINVYRHRWQMASYLTYIQTAEAHQSYLITSLSNVPGLCRTIVGEC